MRIILFLAICLMIICDKAYAFSIDINGAWIGKEAKSGHIIDKSLKKALVEFFKNEGNPSIIDLGAGTGDYTKALIEAGFFASCYDGNMATQDLSDGYCGIIDLSKSIKFSKYDWVLSLEVAEHLPKKFENIFIKNIHNLNKKGIVLSWAIKGQGGDGHVNTQNNDYVKRKFKKLGYVNDTIAENNLRNSVSNEVYWFRNTVMVFRKA